MNAESASALFQGVATADEVASGLAPLTGWRRFVGAGGGEPAIDFLLEGHECAPLVVSLHGHTDRTKYSYPRFERRRSFGEAGFSVLYVADPTLTLDPQIELGWYLGGAESDALQPIVDLIEAACRRLRAPQILLVGSSGGGFAALKLAAMREHWRALVFSPQTSVLRYYSSAVERLELAGFGPFSDTEAVARLSPRLGLEGQYRQRRRGAVTFVQNIDDEFHFKNHYSPFAAMRPEGVLFVLEDHGAGHRPPSVKRVCRWVEKSLV